MMRTLFKQNPKEKKKYKPRPLTRQVGAMDLDRRGELAQFGKWLEFAGKDKSKFPDKEELDKINEDAKNSKSKALGILGILAAIPLITPMLGNLGNLGLDKINLEGLKIPGLPGSSDPSSSDPGTSDPSSGASSSIPRGLGAMGSATAKKLFGKPTKPVVKPTSPAPRRRPGVTTSGGRRPGRPDIRNPLRQRPGVTTGRGGPDAAQRRYNRRYGNAAGARRFGIQAPQNPLRRGPRITEGVGGQKGLDKLVKRLFSSKLGLKSVGKFLRPIIKRIPFVGFLIDFALNVFVFKENLGKAAFKAIGAGLGTWVGGGLGTLIPVPFVGNAIGAFLGAQGGDMLGGWIYDQIFGNQASTKTTAPSDMSADEIVGGTPPANDPNYQRVSYETADSRAQVTSGQVVQWLHGNPGREGYRADHGGDNAHDHFSFKTRAAAVEAFRALKKAGYKPNEFEGFTSVGRHSPTGGHFGPVGQPPTYDDTSDGVAFDIPWATYGSGPITQKDYDLSFRAAQIVGAVQAGATVDSKGVLAQRPEQEPAYGSGRDAIASGVRQGTEVAMLSPEAEAMNSGVTIIREQAPIQQQPQPGGGMVPVPVPTGGQGGSIIITGPTLDSMYDTQILLRTA